MRFSHTWIEISNEDCAAESRWIRTWIWLLFILDCTVEAGRLVEEIWTWDLFNFRASLCVSCEIVLRAMRALCYVLLHVLYHYIIQIVGGFQLLLSPIHTVFMCAWLLCLCAHATVSISAYWWSIVEEVMYYAWSLNNV